CVQNAIVSRNSRFPFPRRDQTCWSHVFSADSGSLIRRTEPLDSPAMWASVSCQLTFQGREPSFELPLAPSAETPLSPPFCLRFLRKPTHKVVASQSWPGNSPSPVL